MVGVAAAHEFVVVRCVRAVWLRVILSSRFSVRTHVIGLILVIVVPLLTFGAFLVLRFAAHEQDFMANTVRERTREAAAAIDHELNILLARLLILAGSHYLLTGDLTAFHAQALEAVNPEGLSVELNDPGGHELMSTRAQRDTPSGMAADPAVIGHVVATLLPEVSNLIRDNVTGKMFLAISIPVLRDGQATYALSLNIAPLLPRLLADLNLPPDWIVTIADRGGTTIARNREADRFVGQLSGSTALELFRTSDEGWFPAISREGTRVYVAFAHVKFSGWTVAMGIPDAVLSAPVRRSAWILILTDGVTLALALLLAAAILRRIASAIAGLADYAEAVGRGEHITLLPTGISETDAVARSLHLASGRLQQSAQERAMLLDRTVTAQEAERERIARELHDSVGQYLTALRLGFSAIEPHCACNQTAQQQLTKLKTLAAELGHELNRIA